MLHKTRGVVLGFVRYRETSIIAKIYTEEFGLQSYIENGVRSSKSKGKIALFQPLTLVDLVVYNKPKAEIQRISEIKCSVPFYHIPTDIRKTTIGIFIAEVLGYTLREHSENNALFTFIFDALNILEEQHDGVENFHLYFLIHLSSFLGFGPNNVGDISTQLRVHGISFGFQEETILKKIIELPFSTALSLSRNARLKVLEVLINFYRINMESFPVPKSVQILSEVLE